jgi:hypothetical protein
MTHGDFNAQILHLDLEYATPIEAAPATLIAKLPTTNTELNDRSSIFQPGAREQWFYRHAAAQSPVRTPRCFAAEIDSASQQSFLLLEHIELPAADSRRGIGEPLAETIVRALAHLHLRWWNAADDPVVQSLQALLAPLFGKEETLVGQLYDRAWPRFLEQGFDISARARQFGQALVGQIQWVDSQIYARHQTLVHGDFRLENMHLGQDPAQVVILDWEDVLFGSGMIDLSWFLAGCLTDESGDVELRLLQHYHHELLAGGIQDYSWEDCYEDYRAAMCSSFLQGVLSATLRENASDETREKARVIGRRFCAAADRLNLLGRLER